MASVLMSFSLALFTGCGQEAAPDQNAPITEETAKEIALTQAGFKADEVTFTKVELDTDNGKSVYEIEFTQGNTEYEYDIDVATGDILKQSTEVPTAAPTQGNEPITEEAAKEIALTQAGFKADEVTFTKVKLDTDNGKSVYEIEFTQGNTEYEYDIDAATGDILKQDTEVATAAPTQGNESITEEAAKEIALTQAGFKADEVTFTKVKLETDDGRSVYEIEFMKDTTEYEYNIDAATGEVLSYDVEKK